MRLLGLGLRGLAALARLLGLLRKTGEVWVGQRIPALEGRTVGASLRVADRGARETVRFAG
ncbi:hypothetical protein Gbfr_007_093 [Gluconobacter frateurii M-2]|nr:hypothetical protein Gbfr_007_093 [Gluconobacter frateurii M-2]